MRNWGCDVDIECLQEKAQDETFDVGEDTGTPVSEDYKVPFKFTGTLDKLLVKLGDAGLSAEEQRELDKQEGANELID